MNSIRFKHIIFDCDGTLISSQEAIYQGLEVLLEYFLHRQVSRHEILAHYTVDLIDFGEAFGLDFHDSELWPKVLDKWKEISGQSCYQYALFPGVKELVEELCSMGMSLYVWTGRDRSSTLEILKGLEIAKYFTEFRCVDDTIPKPHPQGLDEMVGEFLKEDIVVIGDTSSDMNGAKSFGCSSIAALWCSYANEESIDKVGANFKARTPAGCLEIIINKGKTHV